MKIFRKKQLIAFIESNTTGTGEKFIRTALNNGLAVIFLTSTPEKYNFLKKLLIHPILINTNDLEEVYNYLKDIKNLKGIFSSSEYFIYNTSEIAKRLSLPHLNPESITNCRNKFRLNQLLSDAKLPFIKSTLIHSSKELNSLAQSLFFPVIAKPNFGTGSVGVKLCSSLEALTEHIESFKDKKIEQTGILIQEYIEGQEFSVEVVAFNNSYHFLGVTKKYLSSKPYFVEVGHEFPASISKNIKNNILRHVEKVLNTVGFMFGAAHIELRIRDTEIFIIEINPRLAGGMIPILIEESQGIQLIDNLIKLYIGEKVNFNSKSSFLTKIKFLLPKEEGVLTSINGMEEAIRLKNIVNIDMYKLVGSKILIQGDFNDRLGYIIAKGENLSECRKAIIKAYNCIKVNITNNKLEDNISNYARSRLNTSFDQQINQLLQATIFEGDTELKLLSDINKAHVIMLKKCNIIKHFQASSILKVIIELERSNFTYIKKINQPNIGNYLCYEHYLVNKLGIEIAGTIHTARSRNDINATLSRLKSRHIFSTLYTSIWHIRSSLLRIAVQSLNVSMPIYSQYQPAMPATYAYYLHAIESALARNQTLLKSLLAIINISPLGSGAGAGSTFPINLEITKRLLGFDNVMPNALDAVANRDAEIMLLFCATMVGLTISRIAQDYQLWSTQEFAFIDLPDDICGISSAMPQKKNPYLLEKIKGKAVGISGKLFASLATMQKVPFSNSVEVGTEALIDFDISFDELIKAIRLLEVITLKAKPIQSSMSRSNVTGLTIATAISDSLVNEHNISFREAHDLVSTTIAHAINENLDPLSSILNLSPRTKDPQDWHMLFQYGKGPSNHSIESMLALSLSNLNRDALFFQSQDEKWLKANELLKKEVRLLTK